MESKSGVDRENKRARAMAIEGGEKGFKHVQGPEQEQT